jgi:hypothetical protein
MLTAHTPQDRAERDAGKDWARESGVAPASGEALAALATRFHKLLAEMVTDPSKRNWIKLFKHMDENGTGTITYSEVAAMVREELRLPPHELPEKMLQVAARPRDSSPAQPASPAQPSPAQPSPAQPSPAQPSPAQPSPAQPSPAQPSPARPCPALPSPAQPSPAQPSPAHHPPPCHPPGGVGSARR